MARKVTGYGTGSVRYDEKRGTYVGVVALGQDPATGQYRRRTVRGTEREVRRQMAELRRQVDAGLPVARAGETVADWLEHWTSTILPRSVEAQTAENYGNVVRHYLIPEIGRVQLAKLTPDHVERMMSALERRTSRQTGRPLSPRTVALARSILRRSLEVALKRGKVARNVAALTDRPKQGPPRIDDAMTAEEADAVLRALDGHRLRALAVLVLMVGMRQGEALRLRWDDVDLEDGSLIVTESKTEAGRRRRLPLPALLVEALRSHRAGQAAERLEAPEWPRPDLVFASDVGTVIDRRNCLRWWHGTLELADVPRRSFHASRHTAATLMLNNGVGIEVVSVILGHSSIAITGDVYAKVGDPLKRQAADVMDAVLGGRS